MERNARTGSLGLANPSMFMRWRKQQSTLVQTLQSSLLPFMNAFQLPDEIIQAPMGILDSSTTVYERYLDQTIFNA